MLNLDVVLSRYKKKIYRAAKNKFVRRAIHKTVTNYRLDKRDAFSMFPDIKQKAIKLREIRLKTLDNLFFYLDKAKNMIERAGGNVYTARDKDSALKIIGEICEGKIIVKSKSLTTEEIGLNAYLEKLGSEVWETDLGEFIVQLEGSKPMHFVTPSIHIPIERVAELFSKFAGRKIPVDANALVSFAKKFLREKFVKADVGITGANVVVAETGSIFLVENEGNIRFVSNAPPIHIVLVGMEKIVPSLEHGMLYIDVLSKYAGYIAPSYISIISGVSKTGDIEKIIIRGVHGPRELHVVFLDNGRSEMLRDPVLREALLCMRCGSCLYECPVYGVIAGYFGYHYFGGIGTIYMSFTEPKENIVPLLYSCMLCGRCKSVCPMEIDVPNMILELRRRFSGMDLVPSKIRMLMEQTERSGSPYYRE